MLAMGWLVSLVGCVVVHETVYDTGSWDDWSSGTTTGSDPQGQDPEDPQGPPAVGDATLFDPQGDVATPYALSLAFGTVEDSALVGSDWDLVFGDDREERLDRFQVRTAADDAGFVVDLGALAALDEVPAWVDPADYVAAGEAELPDGAEVIVGHVYYVHALDADTDVYGIVRVQDHDVDEQVRIHWCRSATPDGFTPPPGC